MSLVAGELAQVLAPSNALIDSVQGHLVVGAYPLILHQVLPILFEHLDSLRNTEPRGTNQTAKLSILSLKSLQLVCQSQVSIQKYLFLLFVADTCLANRH